MVFRHRAAGSGQVIETMNPIYEYGVDTGNPKPPLHKGEYPSDVITHKHPEPKGERPRRYDDRTPPSYSESGSNYAGLEAGKSAAPNVNGPRGKTAPLDRGVSRGIPDRDRFNQGMGFGAGNNGSAKGDRGVRYTDGEGNVKYRGKSG